MQVAQDARPPLPDGRPDVRAELVAREALEALHAPDPGDVFFDFEGDPLWTTPGSTDWGLEYLFGVVEAPGPGDEPVFRAFWAHDRAQEKQALLDFFAYLRDRRAQFPGMHVYHYAPYEKTALGRLVGRHGVGEEQLDDLLRHGVLVDLYATVRQSVRVSQPSYSLKKLEPLYMGDELRDDELDNAARLDRPVRAWPARRATRAALTRPPRRSTSSRATTATTACRRCGCATGCAGSPPSTASRSAQADDPARPRRPRSDTTAEPTSRPTRSSTPCTRSSATPATSRRRSAARTTRLCCCSPRRSGYHRREDKPFWWAHFDRLTSPPDEWASSRDVLVADEVTVLRDWFKEGSQRSLRRELRFVGALATGSSLGVGSGVWCIYDAPLPEGLAPPLGGVRQVSGPRPCVSVETDDAGSRRGRRRGGPQEGPRALHRGPDGCRTRQPRPDRARGGRAARGRRARRAVARRRRGDVPGPACARRPAPAPAAAQGRRPRRGLGRRRRGGPRPAARGLRQGCVHLRDHGRGPTARPLVPRRAGTARAPARPTSAARVIERLVRSGWHVGVVAPSHAVVEHLLDKVVEAGVPAYRVGKKPQGDPSDHAWTAIGDKKQGKFLGEHKDHGCVIGGTAWDFANANKIGRRSLDLLVVDEAGQFSLANTVAVSVAAENLLLLGDPQQLPQVSQGTHPEPVDGSALGWVADGHDALPPGLGYFLERTWRMHPELCAPVSRLSYEGRLHSEEDATTARHLEGLAPGVHVVSVPHRGNAVSSMEEAAAVVEQVQSLLGRTWHDGEPRRPLAPTDLLVVAAVQRAARPRREAPAASRDRGCQGRDGRQVPGPGGGCGSRDDGRVVGRGGAARHGVPAVAQPRQRGCVPRSVGCGDGAVPALTDYVPTTPEALCELGAFIGLCSLRGVSRFVDPGSSHDALDPVVSFLKLQCLSCLCRTGPHAHADLVLSRVDDGTP